MPLLEALLSIKEDSEYGPKSLKMDANLFRNTVCSAPSWLRSRNRSVNFGSSLDRLLVDPYGAKRTHLRRDELPGFNASELRPRWILHSHGVAVHLPVHRYTQKYILDVLILFSCKIMFLMLQQWSLTTSSSVIQ